jgi:two-component system sensor histidine kinase RegB
MASAFHVADERLYINAVWLLSLRWVAVFGQLATITVVHLGLGVEISFAPLLVAVGVTALSNLAFGAWVRLSRSAADRYSITVWHTVLGSVMWLDLIVLTSLLYFTGGPSNPFSIFYFVNLALSGILLPARWAWFLNGFAIACVALISYQHHPVTVLLRPDRLQSIGATGRVTLAHHGFFVAFVTCCSVIVYFATRLTGELQRREQDLRRAEMLRARSEKLEALGTLAAGAAHELATPLSTIAVVVKEVQRELNGKAVSKIVVDDIALLRSELDRCRAILDRMSVHSGRAADEPVVATSAEDLVRDIQADMSKPELVHTTFAPGVEKRHVSVPRTVLTQALRGLVQNAVDAGDGREPIHVDVDLDRDHLRLRIEDRGPGMTADVLARAGEPFFTTKEPGKGMGLGLFLARSLVERLGGTLTIQSSVGQGTTVWVRVPLAR